MIQEQFVKLGIPTYITQLQIDLPAVAKAQNLLGQDVPTNIAWVYGLSVTVDGTAPLDASQNLISLSESKNLWLTLMAGTNIFQQNIRLSDLLYVQGGVMRSQPYNFCPVSIPSGIDWKTSYIQNPNGVTSKSVLLNIYYIDKPTYNNLVGSGVLWKTGIKPPQS